MKGGTAYGPRVRGTAGRTSLHACRGGFAARIPASLGTPTEGPQKASGSTYHPIVRDRSVSEHLADLPVEPDEFRVHLSLSTKARFADPLLEPGEDGRVVLRKRQISHAGSLSGAADFSPADPPQFKCGQIVGKWQFLTKQKPPDPL